MNASRNRPHNWILTGVGLATLALGTAIAAEPVVAPTAGPRELNPPSAAPVPSTPDIETRTLAPAAGDQGGAAIEVIGLTAPDPLAVGTLTGAQGGLGARMWNGVSHQTLLERLPQLPAIERSPAMRDLTRRMLLSVSAGPDGEIPKGTTNWFALRLQALNALGFWQDTVNLATRGPKSDIDVAHATIDAQLLMGADANACTTLRGLAQPPDGAFWSKARGFCQIVDGDTAAAQLTLDVLRESGDADDAFFAAAAKTLENKKPATAPDLKEPIQFAMWRKAGLNPPPQLLDMGTAATAQLAASSAQDSMLRLTGVGLAARLGLKPTAEWVSLVASETLDANQKDDPEEAAKKLNASAGDALYLRFVRARVVPAAKASAFAAMLGRGQSRGEFPFVASALREDATAINPLPETAWATPMIARVLIYNGEVTRAEQWFKALSFGSPSDQPVINSIQIYGWLKDPTPERAGVLQSALRWLTDTAAKPGPNKALANARLMREAPILAALGVVLPPDASWALDANSPGLALNIDGPDLLRGMAQAADRGAKGEMVMNAALLLKGQGASAARSQTVAAIVRTLMKSGLRKEAKALALEAVLGASDRPGG